jgi:E3 ubiquitin-protein ligase UBR3
LKRELIYKLAVGDATHSQIVKSLPRDLSSSEQLQNVLDSLAVYSNPSGMKQVSIIEIIIHASVNSFYI